MKTVPDIDATMASEPSDLSRDDLTDLANQYLQSDAFPEAYPYLSRLAGLVHDNPRASVMAGLVALKLDRHDRAIMHFRQAVAVSPDDYDANYNLALLEMQAGELDPALQRLRRLARLNPGDAGLHNDIAVLWMRQNRQARAEACFYRALRCDPNYSQARNNAMQFFLERRLFERGKKLLASQEKNNNLTQVSSAEIMRWKEVLEQAQGSTVVTEIEEPRVDLGFTHGIDVPRIGRIAVFASHQMFIKGIVDILSEANDVRLFGQQNIHQIGELMEWADLAFFEWCDDLIIEATRLPKRCLIICRLHSYEVFTDMPTRVDWSKVEHLIFVNESVRDIFQRQVKTNVPTSVIYNGVDLDRFRLPEHKRYGKKIASVGYINYKKNPALLLYCFKKIHQYDPEYTLHIAGIHQDPRIAMYFQHFLKQNPLPISFDGWVEDMPQWYADKDFVISTSLFESFHYSIAEGMASGLIPLIHDWYGADNLYPDKYFFSDPDQCLELIMEFEKSGRYALAIENRNYIARRFDQRQKTNEIIQLLFSLTQKPALAEV